MRKILSILFTLFVLLFFSYYLLFFRFFSISYTFDSNKVFFKWLFRDPMTLVLVLTPGTELHNTYLNFDPLQEDSVFNAAVDETLPLSTPITDGVNGVITDVPTWPEYLSFSDSHQVYAVFNSLVTSAQVLPGVQKPSEEWNWETNMVSGDVVAKDSQKMMLGLNVASPEQLVSQGNPHVFKVGCTVETSILVSSSNLEALEYDINFLEKVSVGDIVYAYCTSTECIGLGRGCVLVEVQSE